MTIKRAFSRNLGSVLPTALQRWGYDYERRKVDRRQQAARPGGISTRSLFYKGQREFLLVLSLIFQYTSLTAFGQKRLVSYLAVPYSQSLIKYTACM